MGEFSVLRHGISQPRVLQIANVRHTAEAVLSPLTTAATYDATKLLLSSKPSSSRARERQPQHHHTGSRLQQFTGLILLRSEVDACQHTVDPYCCALCHGTGCPPCSWRTAALQILAQQKLVQSYEQQEVSLDDGDTAIIYAIRLSRGETHHGVEVCGSKTGV